MNTKKQTNKKTKKQLTLIELWKEETSNGSLDDYDGRGEYHEHEYDTTIDDAYGVELEVKNYDEDTLYYLPRFLKKHLDINCEYDGSLCDEDMELISQPYDIETWKENKDKIYQFFDLLNYLDIDTNSETGFHVHISHDLFGTSEDQVEENINKLYLILENYKDIFKKFSRRSDYYYCQFLSDKRGDKPYKDTLHIKNVKEYDHYHAINYDTSRTNTIELRFFNSTTSARTFMATMQLVWNLVEIIQRDDITTLSFNDIINLHEEYTELIDFCEDNKLKSNIKIVDKTTQVIVETLRNNARIYKNNIRYHNYRRQVVELIKNNTSLISNDYNNYCNLNRIVSDMDYIFTEAEDGDLRDVKDNLYALTRQLNSLLGNYTLETIYDITTGRTKQKRTFNKKMRTEYKDTLNKFIEELTKKGGVI